ncbi:AAEL010115-PA [Aedes aegypti]|uniref:AAEL010115-PA n=1 Tax=Aedes aegypti TaxID=7159 RepID=Q16TV6_AEDAE|nr:AAEL010115-PA [Aedes aegypti]
MVYGLIHNKSEDKDAVQEKEDIHSKILTMFDNVQQKIVNLFNPGAVVDKATAKDYETNPIEDYEALRLGIVNAVDFFAKQINNALNKPRELFRKANKKFTKTLNDYGTKLIGLE